MVGPFSAVTLLFSCKSTLPYSCKSILQQRKPKQIEEYVPEHFCARTTVKVRQRKSAAITVPVLTHNFVSISEKTFSGATLSSPHVSSKDLLRIWQHTVPFHGTLGDIAPKYNIMHPHCTGQKIKQAKILLLYSEVTSNFTESNLIARSKDRGTHYSNSEVVSAITLWLIVLEQRFHLWVMDLQYILIKVVDPSRRNAAIEIWNHVIIIVVAMQMSALPINPFKMSQQSLSTLWITFTDPSGSGSQLGRNFHFAVKSHIHCKCCTSFLSWHWLFPLVILLYIF